MNIKGSYAKVISSLIDCYLRGEFNARYLANEILSVPLPKEKNESEKEELEKYYTWLVESLKPETEETGISQVN